MLSLSSTSLLPSFMFDSMDIAQNQFLYTDEYCDAIQYEGLVFAATTRGTVFAWNPYDFGTFVFHRNYNCFSTCMRVSKFPFTN